jgi:hypothetical protein
VRWRDPEGLNVKANQLAWFVLRAKIRIISEAGGIPWGISVLNTARSYLDNVPVMGIPAALHCQIRNDPGKSNLEVFFLLWVFPGDENLASSPPSSQP